MYSSTHLNGNNTINCLLPVHSRDTAVLALYKPLLSHGPLQGKKSARCRSWPSLNQTLCVGLQDSDGSKLSSGEQEITADGVYLRCLGVTAQYSSVSLETCFARSTGSTRISPSVWKHSRYGMIRMQTLYPAYHLCLLPNLHTTLHSFQQVLVCQFAISSFPSAMDP